MPRQRASAAHRPQRQGGLFADFGCRRRRPRLPCRNRVEESPAGSTQPAPTLTTCTNAGRRGETTPWRRRRTRISAYNHSPDRVGEDRPVRGRCPHPGAAVSLQTPGDTNIYRGRLLTVVTPSTTPARTAPASRFASPRGTFRRSNRRIQPSGRVTSPPSTASSVPACLASSRRSAQPRPPGAAPIWNCSCWTWPPGRCTRRRSPRAPAGAARPAQHHRIRDPPDVPPPRRRSIKLRCPRNRPQWRRDDGHRVLTRRKQPGGRAAVFTRCGQRPG